MKGLKDITILGAATAGGGIPEDLETGLVQVIIGFVTWGLTKLFEWLGRKKK